MRATNTNFDTKHDLSYKHPVYLVHFDGETTDYTNHQIGSPSNTIKKYLIKISGLSQTVIPDEGKASVSGVKFTLLDVNDEITALFNTDTNYFHRKKTTIKAGYKGMNETDMLTIFTGWVTGYTMERDGTAYTFTVTDPIKWMQRKIFRGAETTTVNIQGNPLTVLLRILTSTGNGTNGDYDDLAAANGLGIDNDYIDVSGIEDVRDNWYPGDSNWFKWKITKREKAKEWFEREIFKVLNIYPVIDGRGRLTIKPFKPPLPVNNTVQSFNADNIIGLPQWDGNLSDLVNEIEFFYDYSTGGEYQTEEYHLDQATIDARGPGKKPITIKSRGLLTSWSPASVPSRKSEIITRRVSKIFGRYLKPPIRLRFNTFFSRWPSEAGDIVPFTHPNIPDIETGSRGYTNRRMEIINRSVDWAKGQVRIELLDTNFDKRQYGAISPTATLTTASASTSITVSTGDVIKFSTGDVVCIRNGNGNIKSTSLIIKALTTNTGVIEVDNTSTALVAGIAEGWKMSYSNFTHCTTAQQLYGFICRTSTTQFSDGSAAHLITP